MDWGALFRYFDLYRDERIVFHSRWMTHDSMPKDPELRQKVENYTEEAKEAKKSERPRADRKILLRNLEERIDFNALLSSRRSALGQWLALFAGVLIQPFFQTYQTTHVWAWNGISGWVLFALITSFVAFPSVYRHAFDTDRPVIVQLAPIFTAGLGWQSLVTTALQAATGKH